jgi:hypothetical protein
MTRLEKLISSNPDATIGRNIVASELGIDRAELKEILTVSDVVELINKSKQGNEE